jgi:hypothetical protein
MNKIIIYEFLEVGFATAVKTYKSFKRLKQNPHIGKVENGNSM